MKLIGMTVAAVAALAVVIGLQAGGASAQTPTPTPTSTATATPTATGTAAATPAATPIACPSGVTISVAPPAAGSSSVTVTVTPPQNIKAATAGDPTSYHLHYFIDTPPLAAGTAIPTGNPKIIHSGSLTQDLGALDPGSHTVYVVLGQLSHTACEARGQVTFNVAAAPTAPKTGTGGLVGGDASSNAAAAFAFIAVAAMLALGARAATRRAS